MMSTSLFSIFDPSTTILSFNWSSMILPLMLLPIPVWLIPSRSTIIMTNLMNSLNKEFKILMGKKYLNKTSFVLITIMMYIAINNFMGLFPYIFTATSHIMITIMLALPLWLSILLFGWINNTLYMWAHMLPQGTPKALMVFMVLIETTSVLIRPITLSVRLAANMIAGHLLLSLLGDFTMYTTGFSLPIMILLQNLLLILECAVAIIQAYVFVVLVGLYISEAHH